MTDKEKRAAKATFYTTASAVAREYDYDLLNQIRGHKCNRDAFFNLRYDLMVIAHKRGW